MANQQGHRPEEKFGLQFRRSVVVDISLKTDSGFKDQIFYIEIMVGKGVRMYGHVCL